MDRTLYLTESGGTEVARDGPSVWIRQEGKAGRRVPARLVGRVVVIGNVRLNAGAVTLFTENGIPVIFMNMRGEETAVTLPYNHQIVRHYEEQRVLLETEENTERFRTWLASRQREARLRAVSRLAPGLAPSLTAEGMREEDYRKFLSSSIKGAQEKWAVVKGVVGNLCRELIIADLLKADLDPHVGVVHRRHNFALALDLYEAMSPEADVQALQFLISARRNNGLMAREHRGWAVSSEGMKEIVHRFENRRKPLREKVGLLIDDVFELMRELRGAVKGQE